MLTSCPTLADELLALLDGGFDTDASDPISRSGPEGLPCQVEDADLWFAETPGELERAKSFCASCPARPACLSGAVDRREPWGVWGGEIFERGAIVTRKRPRGRPRKADREVAA
jgi:WhiB family transcriptional regulator, redox-sensing transcriptional regulator